MSTYKDDLDYKVLSSLILLNLNYPLFKETNLSKNYLTPIISLRYSPNKGLNLKSEKIGLTYDSIYNLDRISEKTIEKIISQQH